MSDVGGPCLLQAFGEAAPEGCDAEVAGARAAAALLRLGKLRQRSEESLIIEMEDDCRSIVRLPPVQPQRIGARAPEEDLSARPVVEADLAVLDCDSEDEVSALPGCLPPVWAPGSSAGRRLMKARAQQCVVCMEDKEHTFVPPHREEGSGQLVAGHRFCTDCWAEYLYHSLRQHRRGQPFQPLACPLCRGAIEVPDVWGIDVELPPSWRQPALPEDMDASARSSCAPSMGSGAQTEPLALWADAAPGPGQGAAGPSTNAAAAASASECSPLQGGGAARGQDSPLAASSPWRALRCPCPVPGWQHGCFRRLRDALSGATLVQDLSLSDALRSV